MQKRRSTSWTLALICPASLAIGARGCPVREVAEDALESLSDHEDRIEWVEACTCCCDGRFALVCGNDDHTYLNQCEAECAGVSVEYQGRCEDASACDLPNPAGCLQAGCPDGEVCFRSGNECVPSACTCDSETGSWICTDDCGGGVCIGVPDGCSSPNPAGCSTQTPCPDGEICYRDGNECVPSACICDGETDSWLCTQDCTGGRCIGGPQGCTEPNPAGCSEETPCPSGETCYREGNECLPSACICDNETGSWLCTQECGGGRCIGGPQGCVDPNPAGCSSSNPCSEGDLCLREGGTCLPSSCICEGETGTWFCTDDCEGGICVGG
jgi:hypothetical protein